MARIHRFPVPLKEGSSPTPQFHQPSGKQHNFHSLDVTLAGGLVAILTLVYMNFFANQSVISACNQGSSMTVCTVSSLTLFSGVITFLIGLALGAFTLISRR